MAGDPAGNAMHYAVLALAGVQLPFVTLPVVSRDDFAQQVGQPYQGTLGRDFFDRVVVQVDYHRQTVQLYDPSAFTYTGPGKSFPLTFSGPVPLIRAKFEVPGHRSEIRGFRGGHRAGFRRDFLPGIHGFAAHFGGAFQE